MVYMTDVCWKYRCSTTKVQCFWHSLLVLQAFCKALVGPWLPPGNRGQEGIPKPALNALSIQFFPSYILYLLKLTLLYFVWLIVDSNSFTLILIRSFLGPDLNSDTFQSDLQQKEEVNTRSVSWLRVWSCDFFFFLYRQSKAVHTHGRSSARASTMGLTGAAPSLLFLFSIFVGKGMIDDLCAEPLIVLKCNGSLPDNVRRNRNRITSRFDSAECESKAKLLVYMYRFATLIELCQ